MPLNTYRGLDLPALLAEAQAEFGDDAVIVRTQQIRAADGRVRYELVAGDAAAAAAAARTTRAAAAEGAPKAEVFRRAAGATRRDQDLLAFVGPTGAGKTTMLAKLASHPSIFGHRKVGLLCLDTYRVGAVEQLTAYADLAGRPIEVAYDASDLKACLERLARVDVILVDCPGRSPKQQQDLDAVREMLRRLAPTEVHCVLPAGLRTEHARRVIDVHHRLGLTHLCATKLDEYPDDWALFDLAALLELPMRWVGDGQSVPQDVRSAASRLDAARAARRHGTPTRRQESVA